MTNNVRFTFSVGDNTRAVWNYYWAQQISLMTLNTIFSIVGRVWWLDRLPSIEFHLERNFPLVVGMGNLALLSNEHGYCVLTGGCGHCHPRNKKCYIERRRRHMRLISKQWVFRIGLYMSTALSRLLPINNFIFVCLVWALFLSLILFTSPIFVNLIYIVKWILFRCIGDVLGFVSQWLHFKIFW